jgi:hypothetical protein
MVIGNSVHAAMSVADIAEDPGFFHQSGRLAASGGAITNAYADQRKLRVWSIYSSNTVVRTVAIPNDIHAP